MEFGADIESGLARVEQQLLEQREAAGHWIGELSSSALAVATAVTALQFYYDECERNDADLPPLIDAGIAWLAQQQNSDGGFGDTTLSHSNISTTMLAVAAFHACGRQQTLADAIASAQAYIDQQGGIAGLKARYGNDKTFAVPILAHCAMAGIVPWKEVSALPFEAACVPQRFYHLMQLPVVSYAIPALVAIGQAKFVNDPPWDPLRKTIRRLSVEPTLKVLQRMQPESGGFLEAVPLTSFVAMALIKCGRHQHPVVESAIRYLKGSFRDEGAIQGTSVGTWPIDTNLAAWGTTLSVNAMANDPIRFREQLAGEPSRWQRCVDWILGCQTQTKHPFTGARAGGFGWTDLSGAVPDADDTPGALIALRHFFDHRDVWSKDVDRDEARMIASATAGVDWLLGLQNRDSGWPTFCKGWGKLPFDRSGSDLTAHAIRGLLAWQDRVADSRIDRAIGRGFEYLQRQQLANGSWLPLWFGNQDAEDEINPWYGTAKVLLAYRDANLFDTEPAKAGLEWIIAQQYENGGWGGGESLRWDQMPAGSGKANAERNVLGNASVEETALCLETLLCGLECDAFEGSLRQGLEVSTRRGVQWLLQAIELECVSTPWPIGFYFAKLWYFEKLYPLIFATSALTKAYSTEGLFHAESFFDGK